MAHLADSAVFIVGETIHHHRDPARAVALVADFLHLRAFQLARAALDGALHRVLGHVFRLRLGNGETQPRVAARIRAAVARGNRQLANEAGEHLAALGVFLCFLVFDICPFTVTGHRFLLN